MKTLGTLCAAIAITGGMAIIVIPASSQAKDCDSTLSGVLQGIVSQGAIIAMINRKDATSYEGNPFPNSEHLIVALAGSGQPSTNPKKAAQAAQNILNSPSLNLSWARQIMAACPDIAIVGFGMWQTGWQNMFYRFRDGQVRPKVCTTELDPSRTWGVGWCD
jgi:hypothetical protein